ncbi:carboxypeptidase Y-deficient [Rhodotorula kratochvilovae]
MASPGYATYTPKRHHSSASSISSLQHIGSPATPPHGPSPLGAASSSSRTLSGLVRPPSHSADSGSFLRAPQPSRPPIAAQWSGLSGSSAGGGGGGSTAAGPGGAGPWSAQPSQNTTPTPGGARSPPPAHSGPSARPTPPPSTFPFAAVPPGQSPFPPATPDVARVRSPDKSGLHPHPAPQHGPRGSMPYRVGFQPQGVRRDRSDAFFEQRKRCSEARKLYEGRLARRLEKLVALHFPQDGKDKAVASAKGSPLASLSSLGDSLRTRTAKELWRSTVGNVDVDVERAEQAIVKWQDDKDATHCPICTAAFGVRVRRHHCRLCGRVVCFLPPTPFTHLPEHPAVPPTPDEPSPIPKPIRRERCSTFFTYETQALGEEKRPFGVIVEVPPVEQDLSIDAVLGPQGAPRKEKDERKKVRVCRDCLGTVLRQQLKTLPVRTPTWLKLYEVLVQLEKEIDETLPEFQELAVILSNPAAAAQSATPPSAHHAKTLRKRLLTDLASYDTVSKRIRDLPLPEGAPSGGSQDRLQRALAARGQLFLSEKLGLLRSLGNVEELGGKGKARGGKDKGAREGEYTVKTLASLLEKEELDKITEKVGPELEAAAKLNVLREQEQLVQSYVDDANSRRQFEDAAALQASLEELGAEIAAVSATLP